MPRPCWGPELRGKNHQSLRKASPADPGIGWHLVADPTLQGSARNLLRTPSSEALRLTHTPVLACGTVWGSRLAAGKGIGWPGHLLIGLDPEL